MPRILMLIRFHHVIPFIANCNASQFCDGAEKWRTKNENVFCGSSYGSDLFLYVCLYFHAQAITHPCVEAQDSSVASGYSCNCKTTKTRNVIQIMKNVKNEQGMLLSLNIAILLLSFFTDAAWVLYSVHRCAMILVFLPNKYWSWSMQEFWLIKIEEKNHAFQRCHILEVEASTQS